MGRDLQFERSYETVFAGSGAQMILCSYGQLRRWEHDDLRASHWRWYWNDTGGASIRSSGQTVALRPDRVVLVPPDTPFSTATRAVVGHLYIHFVVGARLLARFQQPLVRHPSADEIRMIRRLRDDLRDGGERHRHDRTVDFRSLALVNAALSDIAETSWETKVVDKDVARALALMHERPADRWNNQALGQLVCLSTNTFLRRFKRATGTSPHRYLCKLRIDNAASDLAKSDDSIEVIATRNGFCDRFHLSRAFQKTLHVSPAAHRSTARMGNLS